jgi:protein-L-isoaspartate(D-aspartate) O-methyltransferase
MMTLEECRNFYAQEIRFVANLTTPGLMEAFARVPREKYLGPPPWQLGSPEQRALSMTGKMGMSYHATDDPRDLYHNLVVPLDISRDINNGQPSALGRWINAMDLKPGDRVYHLGCGVGYYTAIMAEVVGPTGSVVGIELHPQLAARAKENLAGYPYVTVHEGDGATFEPGECDAMLINAGTTHPHPQWLRRLRPSGRLIVPLTVAVTPTLGQGVMAKIVRERGGFSAEVITVLAIFSCKSARDPLLEPLMPKALTSGALLKLRSIRRDIHEQTETCILHGSEVCVSSAELATVSATSLN